jgi:hypothetical protein
MQRAERYNYDYIDGNGINKMPQPPYETRHGNFHTLGGRADDDEQQRLYFRDFGIVYPFGTSGRGQPYAVNEGAGLTGGVDVPYPALRGQRRGGVQDFAGGVQDFSGGVQDFAGGVQDFAGGNIIFDVTGHPTNKKGGSYTMMPRRVPVGGFSVKNLKKASKFVKKFDPPKKPKRRNVKDLHYDVIESQGGLKMYLKKKRGYEPLRDDRIAELKQLLKQLNLDGGFKMPPKKSKNQPSNKQSQLKPLEDKILNVKRLIAQLEADSQYDLPPLKRFDPYGGVQDFAGGVQDFDGSGTGGKQIVYREKKAKTPKKSNGRAKGVTPPHLKKWLDHVAKVRKAFPNLAGKEVLLKAKSTYKK